MYMGGGEVSDDARGPFVSIVLELRDIAGADIDDSHGVVRYR